MAGRGGGRVGTQAGPCPAIHAAHPPHMLPPPPPPPSFLARTRTSQGELPAEFCLVRPQEAAAASSLRAITAMSCGLLMTELSTM